MSNLWKIEIYSKLLIWQKSILEDNIVDSEIIKKEKKL